MSLITKKRAVDILFIAKAESDGRYRVLLLRRAQSDSYGGLLKPIGGKAEEGEPLLVTISREAAEEGGEELSALIGEHHFTFWYRLTQSEDDKKQITNVMLLLDDSVERVSSVLTMEDGVTFEWLDSSAVAALVDGSSLRAGVPDGVNAAFPDTKAAALRALRILEDPEFRSLIEE